METRKCEDGKLNGSDDILNTVFRQKVLLEGLEERSPSPSFSSGSESNEESNVELPLPGSPTHKVLSRKGSERSMLRPKNKTKGVYTVGRPPWYDSHGQLKEAFIIGLCGGSASGKTTVAKKIISELGVPWVIILSLDSFYKVLTHEQHEAACNNEYNFDHPDAFDWDLAVATLRKLKDGRSVQVITYLEKQTAT